MVFSKVHTHTSQQSDPDNTGYTYSLSSSYSSTALEYEREHRLAPVFESPRMSRRSLRLRTNSSLYGDDSLLDSSVNRSVSYSTESRVRRESKTTKSRRSQHSVSGSGSLFQTPVKSQSLALQTHNSSLHSSSANDASLLSSLLDESSIQENTLMDSFWGLDKDGDLKDQTLHADHSFSLNNSGTHVAQTQTSTLHSNYMCNNCVASHSDRRDTLQGFTSPKTCSSSSCFYSSAALHSTAVDGVASAAASTSFSSPHTTVYSRERSRRHKAGVLGVVSEAFLHYSRRACASVLYVFTILVHNVVKTCQLGKVLLCSLAERCVRVGRRAGASSAAALTLPAQFIGLRKTSSGSANGGHASYCGTMNINEKVTQKDPLNLNGPLCDDCKEKQTSRTISLSTGSSRAPWLIEALWVLVTFTGGRVLKTGQGVLSAAGFITKKILSILYLAAVFPGSAASGALQWLGTAWYQLVMLMSLLNVFFLTRILPVLQKLFLIILPFILSLAVLWYWGIFSFSTIWPVANMTTDSAINKAIDVQPDIGVSSDITLPDTTFEVQPDLIVPETKPQEPAVVSEADSERLARIEQSLGMLWDKVATSGGKQEERHAEVLGLCSSLKEELRTNTDKESMGQWVGTLLEQRLNLLREEMEKETELSQKHQEDFEAGHQTPDQESRLAKIEDLLQDLTQKTEELQTRQEVETPVSTVSGEMDSDSHAILLAQVRKLEEALSSLRSELQGVSGCKGRCEQLDSLHDTISAQVKKELQILLYGSEQQDVKLPGSLMQWLSSQFVSNSDLLTSLAAFEKRILDNLAIQLEEMQQKPSEEMVTQSVLQATEQSGLSEEDVQLIVQNALKLYSEDRIGLVDYALESGGGSILSTRCSETYETKTALMSLFGFPLWYFSQSPRAVIQPDVHPGNCWAFKGSTGYLVIRLCVKIIPTAFSLEHIPKALSPTGNISSAPRNFTVYGLEDEQQEEGHLLGQYVYEEDGDALQTYPVMSNNPEAFQIIELRVLSNWGHPEYTCLYRFRVHGEPIQQ